MIKREIRGDSLFVVEEFMEVAECMQWIEAAEKTGFSDAPITTSLGPLMRKDVRNNTRIMYDSPALAEQLYERAKPFLIATWYGRSLIGFNERFRFYKYTPGQRFAPHYDGRFERENGERSEFTFLIYLNSSYVGGNTRFYEPERVDIEPVTGTALVFRHSQLHEGTVIEQGTKYVLRTDVMYGECPP
ncbi:MAG: 2OG-Fe(II) oxygenase [Planctomycetaceae bacterium]|nr:2OG-Fe(II) oxygenase [Planctomycetaceae bacterium]